MTRKYVKPCKRDEQISMQLSIKTASYENLGSESFNLSFIKTFGIKSISKFSIFTILECFYRSYWLRISHLKIWNESLQSPRNISNVISGIRSTCLRKSYKFSKCKQGKQGYQGSQTKEWFNDLPQRQSVEPTVWTSAPCSDMWCVKTSQQNACLRQRPRT